MVYELVKDGLIKAVENGEEENGIRTLYLTSAKPCSIDVLISHIEELIKRLESVITNFEYVAIFTGEGNGVIHMVLRRCYLPNSWFSDNWLDIHDAFFVRGNRVSRKYQKGNLMWIHNFASYLGAQRDILYVDCSGGWLD